MSFLDFIRGLSIGKKQRSTDPLDRANFALFIRKNGKTNDMKKIYPLITDANWNVRNAATSAMVELVERYPQLKKEVLSFLHELIEKDSLAVKLSILEVLGHLKDYESKPYLVKILEESDYDLQYAAIRAIGYLDDVDVLYSLKNVVYARDYITRRAAILSVVRIANSVEEKQQVEKLSPHIHILIESYIEIDLLGDIISKILDYGDPDNFPEMKGYTESEIVKLEGLIEQKDYNVELYQNFTRLIFPLYFPLAEDSE